VEEWNKRKIITYGRNKLTTEGFKYSDTWIISRDAKYVAFSYSCFEFCKGVHIFNIHTWEYAINPDWLNNFSGFWFKSDGTFTATRIVRNWDENIHWKYWDYYPNDMYWWEPTSVVLYIPKMSQLDKKIIIRWEWKNGIDHELLYLKHEKILQLSENSERNIVEITYKELEEL
jgi:hypothetical protein